MLIQLSCRLSEQTPFYSSLPKPELRQIYDLSKGDVCNSFYFTSSKHCGTHVDAPKHFSAGGRRIAEYSLAELMFSRPAVLDIPLGDNELVEPDHLRPALASLAADTDLILLRSRFGRFRADESHYVERSPGFGPAAAALLMQHFPKLRALAVDFMSISSPAHESAGADAHRVFLGCTNDAARSILLVEDALLPNSLPPLLRVFIVPWMFDGLDIAPYTMLAEAADA